MSQAFEALGRGGSTRSAVFHARGGGGGVKISGDSFNYKKE
jgi:hypothetical protein